MTSDDPYDAPLEAAGDIAAVEAVPTSAAEEYAAPTPLVLQSRLCWMMFLQYFVQGCYLPIVSVYVKDALGFEAWQIGVFQTALAVGPLAAPFILGQVVDRYVPTERVLAACHFSGGLLMLAIFLAPAYWPKIVPADQIPIFWPMIVLGTFYSILYVPSLMLTNSLAFHHLKRRDREFPIVRLFGTIGFVVPAWLVEMWWLKGLQGQELDQARGIVFCFAGIAGLLMGAYCLSLPNTPPDRRDDRRFAPGVVIGMLRLRHFAVLVLVTFLIAIVHNYYFVWNGPFLTAVLRSGGIKEAYEQRISSIGQISEVLVMALVGISIVRFGFKTTLLVGTLAYLTRCLVLAVVLLVPGPFFVSMTLACLGQALHGLCFGCFLAVAFIFVDRVASPDTRGSMQNLFGTFVFGAGMLVGGLVAGAIGKALTTSTPLSGLRAAIGISSDAGIMPFGEDKFLDWPAVWLSCAAIALLCTLIFAAFFPKRAEEESAADKRDLKKAAGNV